MSDGSQVSACPVYFSLYPVVVLFCNFPDGVVEREKKRRKVRKTKLEFSSLEVEGVGLKTCVAL